eukprot:CAMPEP_0114122808 /NCGR_PEP_ID=MMETSP0043_2-20121206/7890_1 /TAXON_ID=464988 /ORGANISM="Hemiselmis andersenii, Strain CCMP644" /LENGTH=188 /DNA_ID=CAMNT_0001215543 /DNA_START=220 /DNA_END=783 /DNA_ORIENTATION=-
MYNGVGLRTVRGSATSGHVQKNLAHQPQRPKQDYQKDMEKGMSKSSIASRKPNKEIMEHQKKRQIELKLMEFREAMEERNWDEDEIEAKVAEVRKKLMNEELKVADAAPNLNETHAMAAEKERETKKFAGALGIRGEYAEGEAFDEELKERRKQERIAKREEEDRRREEERDERERAKRRREKEQRRA